MENRPRFGQEQPSDDDSEKSSHDTPRRWTRRLSEGYWARVLGESTVPEEEKNRTLDSDVSKKEKKKKRSKKKSQEEVTVSSDPTAEVIDRFTTLSNKKFERILLPQEDEPTTESDTKDLSSEDDEPSDINEVEIPLHGYMEATNVSLEATGVNTKPVLETDSPNIPVPPDFGHSNISNEEPEDAPGFIDARLFRPATAESISPLKTEAAESAPADPLEIIETEPSAEPESVEAILRRRGLDFGSDTQARPAEITERPLAPKPEVHYRPIVNTGLHLLNYGLALRRDKRNRAEVKQDLRKVNSEIDELKKQQLNNSNIPMQKEQQLFGINNEISHNQIINPIKTNRLEIPTIVEKTTITSPEIEKQANKVEQTSVPVGEVLTLNNSPEALPTTDQAHEEFMRKVGEVLERPQKIESELALDRRHEVKDVQFDNAARSRVSSYDSYLEAAQPGHNSYSPLSGRQQDRVTSKGQEKSDYQKAVTSGVWGAVVGIVVFLVFYMLTNH